MAGLATFNFKLSQLYPGSGEHKLNTCGNPDCSNFGHPMTERAARRELWRSKRPDLTPEQLKLYETNGPGAYKLAGSKAKHLRVSSAFQFEGNPHEWSDQRTIRCLGQTLDGSPCNSGFSILSPDHLTEEVDRLRNYNGVLDGPSCGACGVRLLDKPEEFALNGAHERTKDRDGKPARINAAPKSIRVVHKPCKGKKGARFSVSLPHAGQKNTADNLRILGAVLNSAGIIDIQRTLSIATGKSIGMSRIYDRIAWYEEVYLAYEREMLRRWKAKVEKSGELIEHRLSHDDMVLTVNWETAADRQNTQLNCAITADARSGYVYRLDVDFDPRVAPLDVFNSTYLDEDGQPQNLSQEYPGSKVASAPKFSWQRPTGRFHESQFFGACVNEIRAFQIRAKRRMPKRTKDQQDERNEIMDRTDGMIAKIREISEGWFGFPFDDTDERGPFKGVTTRDTYTKGAHFILLKEMLPYGSIVLTTEQEATLPPLLPHIFDQEIRENRFTWLAMSFNKKATKPERQRLVNGYRRARKKFRDKGLYDGRFDPDTDEKVITEAFIASGLSTALRGTSSPFQISNYKIGSFPGLWVKSPTEASGEIGKVVGFPIVPRPLRQTLKQVPFNQEQLDADLRRELAPLVYKATFQPVSSFMNSLRTRLSVADRAGNGGARVGGTYIQGAIFNPKILVSILNIYRVHYNFFEERSYACPYAEIDDLIDPPVMIQRGMPIPGTDEYVDLPPKPKRMPAKKTPAMRHGMDAFTKKKDGSEVPPDLYRVLYRPWLYMGTKLGTRFERSRKARKNSNSKS
ncbi:hypothetical protein [Cribrihabitans pelagius]|uniref:hypothetical protein n=1 Tax=Cribrihabitans pelagius TaxID=1765746 RepID=UPI003B5B2219